MSFKADYVIKNAVIYPTMEKDQLPVSAMAIWQDKVLIAGSDSDVEMLIGPDTKIWDLGGKCVLPGFNDNHSHPMYYADALSRVNCTGSQSLAELFDRLRKRAAETPPGEWIEAFGYDEMLFAEKREPTLAELDAAVPNHKLYLIRACLHVGLVNSAALREVGYTSETPDPPGGEIVKDDSGKLTGRLCDAASFHVMSIIPAKTAEKLAEYIDEMSKIYNAYGITSTTDMGMLSEHEDEMEVWGIAVEKGYLRLRTAAYLLDNPYARFSQTGIKMPCGNDLFKFAGRKIIMDGSGGGGTARMREPNTHDGKYGVLYHTQEELDEMVFEAHSRGEQIATHAIGDKTIEMVLDAYKKAQAKLPRPDARHRIEHCSFCFPDLSERVINEKIYPLFHPGFLWYFGEAHLRNYGEERLSHEFPFRKMLDNGVIVANGSDCPVTDPNPRPIIYSTVTRKSALGLQCGTHECISMREALWTYTAAGAYLTFDENKKGTLTPGMYADFIVTDIDPITSPPEAILDMKIERTVLGGKVVFEK